MDVENGKRHIDLEMQEVIVHKEMCFSNPLVQNN